MQIDFHHTTTYVVARAAGFKHEEAEIIAYSAQYVDDATEDGLVHFYTNDINEAPKLGPTYNRISSAHKMVDYRNSSELTNRRVWMPFHFLPGNNGQPDGHDWDPNRPFLPRLICRPNSPIAQAIVKACIISKVNACAGDSKLDNPKYKKALCRLGITMHTYVDTWAHQDFVGIAHDFNRLTHIESLNHPDLATPKLEYSEPRNNLDKIISVFTGRVLPLGHGAALSHPDLPFLEWKYKKNDAWRQPDWQQYVANDLKTDKDGSIVRNNTELFLAAADHMYNAMVAFKNGETEVELSAAKKLPNSYRGKIKKLFTDLTDDHGDNRHLEWLDKINAGGYFPFTLDQNQTLAYDPNEKAWKKAILDEKTRKVYRTGIGHRTVWNFAKYFYATALKKIGMKDIYVKYDSTYKYPSEDAFLISNWKLFHDALMANRYAILNDILPQFKICAS